MGFYRCHIPGQASTKPNKQVPEIKNLSVKIFLRDYCGVWINLRICPCSSLFCFLQNSYNELSLFHSDLLTFC